MVTSPPKTGKAVSKVRDSVSRMCGLGKRLHTHPLAFLSLAPATPNIL